MKTKFIFLLHIGFWLCYLFIFIILLAVLNPNENDYTKISGYLKTFLGFALVPCAVSFYGFYLYVFPNYIKTKSILKTIGNGILISMASAIIGFIVMFFIVDEPCTKPIGSAITIILAMFFFMSFIAFIEGFVGFVIRGFIAWYSDIKVKEALLIKTHQTELALLKSQLDPHFLFNTLNNIDVLILKNPNIASEYLNKLSGIMRFMLYETKEEVIPLSKEIEYIKKYIELQKIRTSNTSFAHFNIVGNLANRYIAPMIFIPFIENAFKHCNDKKAEDAIKIEIEITSSKIIFICINKFGISTTKSFDKYNGIGTQLIEKRLQLLYPQKHSLVIDNNKNTYTVTLTINFAL